MINFIKNYFNKKKKLEDIKRFPYIEDAFKKESDLSNDFNDWVQRILMAYNTDTLKSSPKSYVLVTCPIFCCDVRSGHTTCILEFFLVTPERHTNETFNSAPLLKHEITSDMKVNTDLKKQIDDIVRCIIRDEGV